MTDQITVPRETWDAMREALEAEQCIYLHEHMTVPEYIDAALTAANAVSERASSTGGKAMSQFTPICPPCNQKCNQGRDCPRRK